MIAWQLTIPGIELRSLNRDLRGTTVGARMVAAGRAKSQRLGVSTRCFSSFGKAPLPPLKITITRIGPRELDGDNLQGACKHVRDGIADWLGINDRSKLLKWEYAQEKGAPKEYGVKIRVETRVLTLDEMLLLDAPYQKAMKKSDAIWNKLTPEEKIEAIHCSASSTKWGKAHAAQAVRYMEIQREWEAAQ